MCIDAQGHARRSGPKHSNTARSLHFFNHAWALPLHDAIVRRFQFSYLVANIAMAIERAIVCLPRFGRRVSNYTAVPKTVAQATSAASSLSVNSPQTGTSLRPEADPSYTFFVSR